MTLPHCGYHLRADPTKALGVSMLALTCHFHSQPHSLAGPSCQRSLCLASQRKHYGTRVSEEAEASECARPLWCRSFPSRSGGQMWGVVKGRGEGGGPALLAGALLPQLP